MTNPTYKTYQDVRQALLDKQEIALIDVREEDPFAQGHPLFAANLSAGRLELDAWTRIPRHNTTVVVYDAGEGLAEQAWTTLRTLGYTDVSLLSGGLQAWRDAGGEIFIDVNVPSKSFGELVESKRQTPSLSAQEVQTLIDSQANVVVLDVRRFDEYQTMSIPSAISLPGGELVLRAQQLAPNPETRIIVNCAGRTRSIIGAQSLVNANVPNPVSALRNGTIGWTLAGQTLDHGAQRQAPEVDEHIRLDAAQRARVVADRAGVKRAQAQDLAAFKAESTKRTTYFYDVRTSAEFNAAHFSEFLNAPGGQLVQETDVYAPVRGARIVLIDDDGVRANMTGSWLAQMAWDVWVLDGVTVHDFLEKGAAVNLVPQPRGQTQWVSAQALNAWLQEEDEETGNKTVVLDFTTSVNYMKRHIPSAWFVLRSQLKQALQTVPTAKRYVLTCGSSALARFAVQEVQNETGAEVYVLQGGTLAWISEGLSLEHGETHLASPRIDRYRRPYEGTDNPREAMQGYLDWEFGLVAQLDRDGTHGFQVI